MSILWFFIATYLFVGFLSGTFTLHLGYGWKLALLVTFLYPWSLYKSMREEA